MRIGLSIASVALAAAFLISGCLPSSCSRSESRVLSPSDSLSRSVAQSVPLDTLVHLWDAPSSGTFVHPRTLRISPRGRLFVSDAQRPLLVELNDRGEMDRTFGSDLLDIPYLAGFFGDTLVVFNAGSNTVAFFVEDNEVGSFALSTDDAGAPLRYVAAGAGNIWVKVLDDDLGSAIVRYGRDGDRGETWPLHAKSWARAGPLTLWGDTLVSVRGYLPFVDIIADGKLDSLRLSGFDSPMLARTESYRQGDTHAPPLLMSSSYGFGEHLYVVNIRPGWIRLDRFHRDGTLADRWVEPAPSFDRAFYPNDITVRRSGGRIEVFVSVAEGEHAVRAFALPNPPM